MGFSNKVTAVVISFAKQKAVDTPLRNAVRQLVYTYRLNQINLEMVIYTLLSQKGSLLRIPDLTKLRTTRLRG